MTSLIVAPLMLPAIMAVATLLLRRRHRMIGTVLSIAGAAGLLVIALTLFIRAAEGDIAAYAIGGWPAPFGIVLVLDRLASLMLLLTSLLALAVLCHAVLTGLDRRGWHFHPLFQFQLLGLNGAFLTGDLFNLFVFFEVLLIASYGLMLHGQGKERLKAGVQYVIINLVGSTIFLVAIGILYGITGTLNMADMAARIPLLPAGDQGLLRAGALLLVIVFALKAALLPLHLWLPRTYAGSSPAVAALFAIMTKVGVYAMIRTVTLIFGEGAGAAAWVPKPWMLPCAVMTMVIGFVGLLASHGLRDLAAFAVIGSTGTLLIAISLFEPAAMTAGLYYLPHTTFATALLFLIVDIVARMRGAHGDAVTAGPRFAGIDRLALLYLLAAIALAGMPPLSGFIAKLLILQATVSNPAVYWIWATILVSTLLALAGLARAGSMIFWKSAAVADAPSIMPRQLHAAAIVPSVALVLLLGALTVAAGPATAYMEAVSAQLFAPSVYIKAVLGPNAQD